MAGQSQGAGHCTDGLDAGGTSSILSAMLCIAWLGMLRACTAARATAAGRSHAAHTQRRACERAHPTGPAHTPVPSPWERKVHRWVCFVVRLALGAGFGDGTPLPSMQWDSDRRRRRTIAAAAAAAATAATAAATADSAYVPLARSLTLHCC